MSLKSLSSLLLGLTVLFCSVVVVSANVRVVPSGSYTTLPKRQNAPYTFEATLLYGVLTPYGNIPVQVMIQNASDEAGTWQATFSSSSGWGSTERSSSVTSVLTVPARSSQSFTILIPPLMLGENSRSVSSRGHAYIQLRGSITGPGTQNTEFHEGNSIDLNNFKAMAVSRDIYRSIGGQLDTGTTRTTSIQINSILEDWRGLSGFDQLWLGVNEWNGMEPVRRNAVLEWLQLGGNLRLVDRQGTTRTGGAGIGGVEVLQPTGYNIMTRRGLGSYSVIRASDSELVGIINSSPSRQLSAGFTDTGSIHSRESWYFENMFNQGLVAIILVTLLLILFGILVGPVNLFRFARGRRRYRLFITTPLISLATTGLIVITIIVGDGVGGNGGRVALVYIDPELKTASIVQKQLVLTGLLLRSSFKADEQIYLEPLAQRDATPVTQFKYQKQSDGSYRGGVFSNRTMQAQVLMDSRPSRATIEIVNLSALANGEAPVLTSSVNARLRTVLFRDGEGTLWKAEGVRQGERKPMAKVENTGREFLAMEEVFVMAGPLHANHMNQIVRQNNQILAVAENTKDIFIPTLGSIRWNEETCIIFTSTAQ